MFYPKKKSCSVDVLKFWKYNFLLVLLADAVRGCGEGMAKQRENRESREGFLLPEYSGKGHTKRGVYQTVTDDILEENRKSGMKAERGTRFPCPR